MTSMTNAETQRLEAIRIVSQVKTDIARLTADIAGACGALNRLAAEGADVEREQAKVERVYATLADDVLVGLGFIAR
jgi:hypothetical protein